MADGGRSQSLNDPGEGLGCDDEAEKALGRGVILVLRVSQPVDRGRSDDRPSLIERRRRPEASLRPAVD
jgi:hypothetical protein